MPSRSSHFDTVVLGAGLFGLYAARLLVRQGRSVALIDPDPAPFSRASYINQSRLHFGYHYPRSMATAQQASLLARHFNQEFKAAINSKIKMVYAISKDASLTGVDQFIAFTSSLNIPLNPIDPSEYFAPDTVDAAYLTTEYSFDANKIREILWQDIEGSGNATCILGTTFKAVHQEADRYAFTMANGQKLSASTVINATYASTNQVLSKFHLPTLHLKYELCEVIFCKVNKALQQTGITVMDGPFFSIMPFGLTDMHTLYSVSDSPRLTSMATLPTFSCQQNNPTCSPEYLANCNTCAAQPDTAWQKFHSLASNYLLPHFEFSYEKSMYVMRPVLKESEQDDARPTIIRQDHEAPDLITVFSGKVNGIYNLEAALQQHLGVE